MTRETTFILTNISLAVADLIGTPRTCKRCGASFVVNTEHFDALGLSTPRHCIDCRRARRAEREMHGEAWVPE